MNPVLGTYSALKGKAGILARLLQPWTFRLLKIFPVPGIGVLLKKGFDPYQKNVELTDTPRHANMLLVCRPLHDGAAKAAAVAFAQMPRPRMLVFVDVGKINFLPEPDLVIRAEDLKALAQNIHPPEIYSENTAVYKPDFLTKALSEEKEEENGGHQHHHEHNNDNSHDHGGHDHGSGGFMSMVMMTKDQPRGMDGLQMDRNEVRFGPFHPGLPGGLQVKMTIAGDTVTQAEVETGLLDREAFQDFPENIMKLPEWMAGLDPFQTVTYRQLAYLAVAGATGSEFTLDIRSLERERMQNLLLWLLKFQKTLGDRQMERQVFQLWQDFQQNKLDIEDFESLRKKLEGRRYLKMRLQRLGKLADQSIHHFSGPVATAVGITSDLQKDMDEYKNFKNFQLEENNVWGWLLARLEEMNRSLHTLNERPSAENIDERTEIQEMKFSGIQKACAHLETSRGTLRIRLELEEGKLRTVNVKHPSTALAAAVPQVTKNNELADALVAIAALDISPWEINA